MKCHTKCSACRDFSVYVAFNAIITVENKVKNKLYICQIFKKKKKCIVKEIL